MKGLSFLSSILFSGLVAANPIHNIVVFGDSLSDNGNLYAHMQEQLPPSPPYYKGRFSNGPVWVEYLSNSYFPNEPERLQDYAFGGATVSNDLGDELLYSLKGQILQYLLDCTDKANIENNLYIVWIGSNNYIGVPTDKDHSLAQSVNNAVLENLKLLAAIGAKNILIVNLPDIGKTPYAYFLDEANCDRLHKNCVSETLSNFSTTHNEILTQNLEKLKSTYPNVHWLYFDMHLMLNEAISNPRTFGLMNVDSACYEPVENQQKEESILESVTSLNLRNTNKCNYYLFFDLLHPTTHAHKIIAKKIKGLLQQSNIDFS